MALNIEKGIKAPPPKVVIYGVEGIGKTTLASRFPNPLFLDTEEGSGRLDVARVRVPDYPSLRLAVQELSRDMQGFRTLVLDSADWIESSIIAGICADKGIDSLDTLAWGKGYLALKDAWERLLDSLTLLQRRHGCGVVFTAHAVPRKVRNPGEGEPYDHMEMPLEKKTAPLLRQWADFLLYLKYDVTTVTDSKTGRVTPGGGQRVVCTAHTLWYDAKSRAPLPPKVRLDEAGWKSILAAIYGGQPKPEPPKPEPEAKPEPKPEPQPQPEPEAKPEPQPQPEPEPEPQPEPERKPLSEVSPEHNRLMDAMIAQGITDAEMQQVALAKKMYPANTPLANWSVESVSRVLAHFDQIASWVRARRVPRTA